MLNLSYDRVKYIEYLLLYIYMQPSIIQIYVHASGYSVAQSSHANISSKCSNPRK